MGNTISLWLNGSSRPVHPHMHGEYTYSASLKPRLTGSPPHAWGILQASVRARRLARFTPTCMGNTSATVRSSGLCTVHPHMHGEYIYCIRLASKSSGSPPHAWGIRIKSSIMPASIWFTPTCMGNTTSPSRRVPPSTIGSPPHAWGIHRFQARISACPRFTPTCMGNTIGAPAVMVGSSVHPHMHGEYPCR